MVSSSSASLLRSPDAGWSLSLYPSAGEAGGSFASSWRPRRSGWVPGAPAADPERSRLEAARRARAKVRRYCTAHGLSRLGTLTYRGAGCHDPALLRADVGEFFRSLRSSLGGQAFPYVWVPEWHKSDHGMHVHFAVGQFIARGQIDAAWGRGFVHIKRLSDLPVGSTRLSEARRAAGYLSKYVAKSFADDESSRALRLHRYEVAQGFQPSVVRLTGASADDVLDQAVGRMQGLLPAQSWNSAQVEGWQGPPAVWFAWD